MLRSSCVSVMPDSNAGPSSCACAAALARPVMTRSNSLIGLRIARLHDCPPQPDSPGQPGSETTRMVMYLDEDRIRGLLRWDRLIAAMEEALADFSLGRVLQPVRNMLTIEEGKRYLGIMPAVAAEAMGAKLVSFYPQNAASGTPTHMAMIVLFSPQTGEPLAVMDGRLLTEMRTAAASGGATALLGATR